MQIHISPRNVKLTAALHAYVAGKIGSLEDHVDGIIGAHVAIVHDQNRANKHAFVIKAHLAVPGPDLHAEDKGHDLYQAIDLVATKLEQQLMKKKGVWTKKRRTVARRAKSSRQAAA
jgi:putative sigma-54 modulation protein